MAYRVVRPFPLSLDGLTLISLVEGDERTEWGGMEDGLLAEGYIEAVVETVTVPELAPVVEPVVDPAPKPEQRRRRGK